MTRVLELRRHDPGPKRATRAERIAKLKATDRWAEGDGVLGLPKVRVPKVALKKKKKVKKEEEAGAATEEKK